MLGARTAALATAVVATLGSGLMATPADAATTYVGKVDARGGLKAHFVPASGTPTIDSFANGSRIRLVCKVRSVEVKGNDLWYRVKARNQKWVSAKYVDNIGRAPRLCGEPTRTTGKVTTDTLNRREAPLLRADKEGRLHRGDRVTAVCWINGMQNNQSDKAWYQLGNGTWVSARYLDAPGSPYCA